MVEIDADGSAAIGRRRTAALQHLVRRKAERDTARGHGAKSGLLDIGKEVSVSGEPRCRLDQGIARACRPYLSDERIVACAARSASLIT